MSKLVLMMLIVQDQRNVVAMAVDTFVLMLNQVSLSITCKVSVESLMHKKEIFMGTQLHA